MTVPVETTHLITNLAARVKTGEIRQTTIATATGIDQSQVSRILSGRIKRLSRNVETLCKYAKNLEISTGTDVNRKQTLTDKLLKIWDGTAIHADALEQLFLSIDNIQRLGKESR